MSSKSIHTELTPQHSTGAGRVSAHSMLRGYIHLLKGQKLYTISISSGVVRGKHCSYTVTVRHSYLITMQIYGATCRSMELLGVQKTIWWGCNSSISSQRQPATLFRGQKLKTAETTKHSPPWLCQMWGCVTCGVSHTAHCVPMFAHTHRMKKPLLSAPKQGRVNCQHPTSLQQESQQER